MRRFFRLISSIVNILLLAALTAWGQNSQPIGTIAVGDSPFALALTPDQQRAVIVNLFPVANADGTDGPNIRVLDLNALSQVLAFRAGTRLVAVTITGTTALVVNEDQDVLRLIDVNSGSEVAQIPVGSRPDNVIAINNSSALVVNGTSGDLSFVDLAGRRVVGSPVTVGNDPRAAAIHPAGRYVYVALSGDNAVGVLDLQGSPHVISTVSVG